MKNFNIMLIASLFTLLISCSNTSENNGSAVAENGSDKARATEVNNSEVKGTVHITKKDFLQKVMNYEQNQQEWVFEGDKPCIVDFYADWCRPCKIVGPILEDLAVEYAGKIDIYKVNTEKEQELAAVFGIKSIPSFLIVPVDGKPSMSSGIGRTPEETKEMFRQIIEESLLQSKL